MATSLIKNNTGYDIRECSIVTNRGKEELSWFDDGDSIKRAYTVIPPSLVGYIRKDGEDVLVTAEAKSVGSPRGVLWVFNKVHIEDD